MAESLIEIKDSEEVKQLGVNRRAELEKLKNAFKEKKSIGLWWDAKVSENDRKKYYFYLFNMKSNDKENTVKELEKYAEMYGKLENVSECSFEEVEKMDEQVKEMIEIAREELLATKSKAVYKVCKGLISCGIDEKVGKIKNALGTYEFKKLRGNLGQIVMVEAEKLNKEYKEENEELKNEYENAQKQKEEIKARHEAAILQLRKDNEEQYSKLGKAVQESKQRTMEVEEKLEQERANREEMEKRLKEENEIRAREIEKKLKNESQIRSSEREDILMREVMAMSEQMQDLIKEAENLKLGKTTKLKHQSCPNLFSDNSPVKDFLITIDE